MIFPNLSLPHLLLSSPRSFCSSHTSLAVPTTCQAGVCLCPVYSLRLECSSSRSLHGSASPSSGLFRFHVVGEVFLTPPFHYEKTPTGIPHPLLYFSLLPISLSNLPYNLLIYWGHHYWSVSSPRTLMLHMAATYSYSSSN